MRKMLRNFNPGTKKGPGYYLNVNWSLSNRNGNYSFLASRVKPNVVPISGLLRT